MPKVNVVSQENEKVGSIDLSDAVFAAKVNVPLVHQVIKAQLAGFRSGTASTKTKGEVRGGGKKPFKQKGTGNARQGSSRSPLQVGGGTAFGPRPRSFAQKTPKEMVNGALRSVLSDRLKSDRIIVVDKFSFDAPKTKTFNSLLKEKFKIEKVLIVDKKNKNSEKSGRNIPCVKMLRVEGLNVYDVVRHEWLVMTKGAVESLEGRLV